MSAAAATHPARGGGRPPASHLSALNERYPRKRAFVTGCASGLGRALCKELAAAGWTLGMNDVDAGGLAAAKEEVEAIGGDPRPYAFDVARADEFRDAASDFVRRNGGVDLVVNNAGLGAGGFFDGYPLEHWREVVGVNLMGVVHGCHVFLPAMKRAGSGHIVNVASAAALHALPQVSAYNATKAGVLALSETLRAELHGTGVGTSVMVSTFFRSEIAKNTRGTDAEKRKTQGLVDASRLSAEEAARRTLAGVAKNRFYIVMPTQARVLWSFKRHLPRVYLGLLPPLARALDARLSRARRG
jgi:NAD(P)-dependent dehydrogenase (short-subunit alcohol dehydrogenase family)